MFYRLLIIDLILIAGTLPTEVIINFNSMVYINVIVFRSLSYLV